MEFNCSFISSTPKVLLSSSISSLLLFLPVLSNLLNLPFSLIRGSQASKNTWKSSWLFKHSGELRRDFDFVFLLIYVHLLTFAQTVKNKFFEIFRNESMDYGVISIRPTEVSEPGSVRHFAFIFKLRQICINFELRSSICQDVVNSKVWQMRNLDSLQATVFEIL